MEKDVIRDLLGLPMNVKYRPNVERYGNSYIGYKNWNRQVFFYEFAVQNADVTFSYHGQEYFIYCSFNPPYVAVSDKTWKNDLAKYESANELIEKYIIEGKPLIDILDELEDVEQC